MTRIRKKKRVTQNKRTRILKAVASGTPVAQLAEKYGLHFTTINKWMRESGIPNSRARRKAVDELPTKRTYKKRAVIATVVKSNGLAKVSDKVKQLILKALSEEHGIDLT